MATTTDAVWRAVGELMWEAYVAETIPVGAVVTDAEGAIVSRGRNRIFTDAETGGLGRSTLAHAEINAILALAADEPPTDHLLYSSLEPCHLCLAAVTSARLGGVHYAGRDPYGGADGKLLPSEDMRTHPIEVVGPRDDALGRLAELLHVRHMQWRRPDGNMVTFYRREHPELLEAAEALPVPPEAAAIGLGGALALV